MGMRQTQTAKPAISFSVNPLFFNFSHLVSTAGSDGSEEAAIKIKLEDYEGKISAVDGAASQKGTEEQEQQQQQAVEKTQMGTKGGKEKRGKRKRGKKESEISVPKKEEEEENVDGVEMEEVEKEEASEERLKSGGYEAEEESVREEDREEK